MVMCWMAIPGAVDDEILAPREFTVEKFVQNDTITSFRETSTTVRSSDDSVPRKRPDSLQLCEKSLSLFSEAAAPKDVFIRNRNHNAPWSTLDKSTLKRKESHYSPTNCMTALVSNRTTAF